jgi:hypothetical protein
MPVFARDFPSDNSGRFFATVAVHARKFHPRVRIARLRQMSRAFYRDSIRDFRSRGHCRSHAQKSDDLIPPARARARAQSVAGDKTGEGKWMGKFTDTLHAIDDIEKSRAATRAAEKIIPRADPRNTILAFLLGRPLSLSLSLSLCFSLINTVYFHDLG